MPRLRRTGTDPPVPRESPTGQSSSYDGAPRIGPQEIATIIPRFDPDDPSCMDCELWIDDCSTTKEMYGWSDSAAILYSSMRLRGTAKVWYHAAKGQLQTWEMFKRDFIDNFPVKVSIPGIHEQLRKSQKSKNETIIAYFHRMCALGRKISLDDQTMKEYIIGGISPESRRATLRNRSYPSLTKLLHALLETEEKCNSEKKDEKNDRHKAGSSRGYNRGSKQADRYHPYSSSSCGGSRVSENAGRYKRDRKESPDENLDRDRKTKGSTRVKVNLDGVEREVVLHIVPDEMQNHEMIVGRDFFNDPFVVSLRTWNDLIITDNAKKDVHVMEVEVEIEDENKTPIEISDDMISVGESVSDLIKERLKELVKENRQCFSLDTSELGHTTIEEMKIQIISDKIIKYGPYRIPYALKEEVRMKIEELLKYQIIEPMCQQQQKQAEKYNQKHLAPKVYKEGDLVLVRHNVAAFGSSRKMLPRYKGPYIVETVLGADRYIVADTPITQVTQKPFKGTYPAEKLKGWVTEKDLEEYSGLLSEDPASDEVEEELSMD
uniref:Retrotransposon gag domain-containing protein n=1 Tax=Phlebotomus papatasi TaxID=29031 RepID=A0A1B0DRG5_PHLPP